MNLSGGKAKLKFPDLEKEFEVKVWKLGHSLGKVGIPLDSPVALKAIGLLIGELAVSFVSRAILEIAARSIEIYGPHTIELMESHYKETGYLDDFFGWWYRRGVRRGIEALMGDFGRMVE